MRPCTRRIASAGVDIKATSLDVDPVEHAPWCRTAPAALPIHIEPLVMALAPPQPGWCDVIREYAATDRTARRLTEQLRACEAAALAFCRLLERWNRGEALPATPGAREAALRHAADRVETALAGLEAPLSRYLVELEPERAEGRSWYGGPGAGEQIGRASCRERVLPGV